MPRQTLPMLTAAIGLAVAAMPVDAQSAGAFMNNPAFNGPAPQRCDSTLEMQQCAARDLRIADAQMSMRYSDLRARLGAAARQRLLIEQRQWLKDRDHNCIARGNRYHGGSMASVVVAQCWVTVTRARSGVLAARKAKVRQEHIPAITRRSS
jgi:uncharacterized protein YecT (DUF1311 family)